MENPNFRAMNSQTEPRKVRVFFPSLAACKEVSRLLICSSPPQKDQTKKKKKNTVGPYMTDAGDGEFMLVTKRRGGRRQTAVPTGAVSLTDLGSALPQLLSSLKLDIPPEKVYERVQSREDQVDLSFVETVLGTKERERERAVGPDLKISLLFTRSSPEAFAHTVARAGHWRVWSGTVLDVRVCSASARIYSTHLQHCSLTTHFL
jgi:hypothetical protein